MRKKDGLVRGVGVTGRLREQDERDAERDPDKERGASEGGEERPGPLERTYLRDTALKKSRRRLW